MTDPTFKINLGAFGFLLPPNARLVLLFRSATGANSYSLQEGGVNYQVPALKKFKALKCYGFIASGTSTMQLFQADNADGTTNSVNKDTVITSSSFFPMELSGFTVADGKYLNFTTTGATTQQFLVIGIELDA